MSAIDIKRLIAPRSIALIGAGAWTDAVAAGGIAIGFPGTVWRIHPTRKSTAQTTYYRSVAELPGIPDAAFLAVPNHEAPAVAAELALLGAGGFVGFCSGFSETGTDEGKRLTAQLCKSARDMPFFGPNCYGFVNFFDRVALLPDQVVGASIERGVALICQSGTIALTLMYNERSVPIGYLISVGNQTRLAVEDLIEILCDDVRVTAFGLYLEGIQDTTRFAAAAARARAAGKPIAVVKAGRTESAVRTAQSHTGALAGSDAVFDAFCRQAGIARCETLSTLCETLKIFHARGPLAGGKILVIGASGGDMAMTADVARNLPLEFPPLPAEAAAMLNELLESRVTIANPFDMHTYLWFDPPAMRKVFATVLNAGYDAVGFMLDCPPERKADTGAFDAAIEEFIGASKGLPTLAALMTSLPETIGERMRANLLAHRVVPLQGQREALEALALAGGVGQVWRQGTAPRLNRPRRARSVDPARVRTLTEAEGKAALAGHGVAIPRSQVGGKDKAVGFAEQIGFPVVIKAVGVHLTHKTDVGGVVLNIRNKDEAAAAVARLAALSDILLVEEMVSDGVAEVLAGVIVDPQFGQVLVVGAGGVLTELLADTATLLPPWTPAAIDAALRQLGIAKLLSGFRGRKPGDWDALVDAVMGVARFAEAHIEDLIEIDVNPIIVRPQGRGAVAVDALIRLQQE
jgi:acetate---CoA ligase (ADP-forming)